MDLTGPDDVRDILKEKLLDNWLMLIGDTAAISEIERQYYPPGTEKNQGFELIMGPGYGIFLARKTELVDGGANVGENDLIAFVHGIVDNGAVMEMQSIPQGLSREEMIEKHILEPFDQLTGSSPKP